MKKPNLFLRPVFAITTLLLIAFGSTGCSDESSTSTKNIPADDDDPDTNENNPCAEDNAPDMKMDTTVTEETPQQENVILDENFNVEFEYPSEFSISNSLIEDGASCYVLTSSREHVMLTILMGKQSSVKENSSLSNQISKYAAAAEDAGRSFTIVTSSDYENGYMFKYMEQDSTGDGTGVFYYQENLSNGDKEFFVQISTLYPPESDAEYDGLVLNVKSTFKIIE